MTHIQIDKYRNCKNCSEPSKISYVYQRFGDGKNLMAKYVCHKCKQFSIYEYNIDLV